MIAQADVILGLELSDFWGTMHAFGDRIVRRARPITKPGARTISIGVRDLFIKANYQDFMRYQEVDLSIAADAEETLPSLIEQVKRLIDAERKAAFEARGKQAGGAFTTP